MSALAFLPLPPGVECVQMVQSFEELRASPFAGGVNALGWARELPGDFGEIARLLRAGEGAAGIETLDEARLRALPVSAGGRQAIEVMLADFARLRDCGLEPALNAIHGYMHDTSAAPVATDVFSFHADRASVAAETWLCTYHGPATEALRPEDAQRRVEIPETRAALRREFGAGDEAEFAEYLSELCYDLHYVPRAGAQPFSFGVGNLWRIAVEWPGSPVPPCIHRAPETSPGDPPRLLLIC